MLALFLAVPAISYAGSATSRWDLTIGGQIKFDVGWSDYSTGDLGATQLMLRPTIGGYPPFYQGDPNYKYGNQIRARARPRSTSS